MELIWSRHRRQRKGHECALIGSFLVETVLVSVANKIDDIQSIPVEY